MGRHGAGYGVGPRGAPPVMRGWVETLAAQEAVAAKEAVAMKETVAVKEDPVVVEMAVRGMACEMCVRALDRKLNTEVEDLEDLEIDLGTGRVSFRLPDGSKHTDKELRRIVRSAGFSVERVDRTPDGEPGA
jgi:copper chaperone CopZ